MRMSREELVELILTGDYYAIQKKDDYNRVDILLRREDGRPAQIQNYPYRTNQVPAYLFDELVREGILRPDGADENGATIFRVATDARKAFTRAA